jgi:cytoskeletal protein CcmA (bactofilin family)
VSDKVSNVKDLNLIGVGTTIEGKIRSQGSMRIDGKLVGEVAVSESIAIGMTGEVEGNVTGRNITVGGKVRGNIHAGEKLVFEAKATIKGDIRAAKLVVDEGASFDGNCRMTDQRQQG